MGTPILRKFVSPEIIYGPGSRHHAGTYARNFGAKKVLLVTDAGVINAGWVKDIEDSLNEAMIPYVVFSKVSPNPRSGEVHQGVAIYKENQCNVIVAVGGGSPIDCAKGIGIVATNGTSILNFEGVDKICVPTPPLICIPTTAGTSADVSQFCIITNLNELIKISIVSKAVVPDVSLIDPETTRSMSSYLAACTGVDALVHAIEAFVSKGSGPLTDMYALEAISLINDNLTKLIANRDDEVVRNNVMLASMKAGLAFSNAILGAVHAMAHSLGGMLDLAHGECNAILLEHVIAYNFNEEPQKFKMIAERLGVRTEGLSSSEVKAKLLNRVTQLKRSVGISKQLGAVGVKKSDIPNLSIKAVKDACILTNPKKILVRDVEVLYEEAL